MTMPRILLFVILMVANGVSYLSGKVEPLLLGGFFVLLFAIFELIDTLKERAR